MAGTQPRTLDAPMLSFELDPEIARLKAGHQWQIEDRAAITLVKTARLRLVLILMKKGATMHEHRVEGPISLWVVSGAISFAADGEKRTVAHNGLLVLDKAIPHDVEALEDESAFLLTIDQPVGTEG